VRWRAATVGVLVLAAACTKGGSKPELPGATVPLSQAPTTTTTNPYAVPAVIDAAYVERVLAGLDAAKGDVVRAIIAARTISSDLFERLKSLYADLAQFQVQLDAIQAEGRRNFAAYLPNPGNDHTLVTQLISATPGCIYAKVDRDSSAVAKTTNPRFRSQWVALKRLEPSASTVFNPTGWAYLYEGFESNLQAPARSPCLAVS